MLTRFIDPKNDFIFKKLFGSEQNKNILIAFLNDMIDFKEGFPIVDVEFIKNTQDPVLLFGKSGTIDVLCKDKKGHIYIVEMQVAKEFSLKSGLDLNINYLETHILLGIINAHYK
jgi:predicted transposase/invertase (TIGR01784 family)